MAEPSAPCRVLWDGEELSTVDPAVAGWRCCEVPKVLVASLPPYTVETPLPIWLSSRLREDRLVAERTESLRAGERERLELRSSLALEAVLLGRVSERVLDLSWLMRSEDSR